MESAKLSNLTKKINLAQIQFTSYKVNEKFIGGTKNSLNRFNRMSFSFDLDLPLKISIR